MQIAILAPPRATSAGDLSDALAYTREVMGEEAIEGYEQYIEENPDEALWVLMERYTPLSPSNGPIRPRRRRSRSRHSLSDLGNTRLGYAPLAEHIREAARQTGLPAALIDAVIRTESGYRPHAVSRTGAVGLMQLMPGTAREMGVRDRHDPRQNILGGSRYLRKMYDRFGRIEHAIAAYNAGPGNVRKYGGIPPFKETRRYVKVVMARWRGSSVGR